MKLFLSNYTNKVDLKGRVSVPASFRSVLEHSQYSGIVINRSFVNNCIEASSLERMESLNDSISNEKNISAITRDAFTTFLLGNSFHLLFDNEGRVIIPKKMLDDVGIIDKAVFVGKGNMFEIWNPDEFDKYMSKVIEIIKQEKNQLLF